MRTLYKSEPLARAALSLFVLLSFPASALADQLRLTDGSTIEVDEAWEDAQGVWYKRGGVTHHVERSRVRSVVRAKPVTANVADETTKATNEIAGLKTLDVVAAPGVETVQAVWIFLVGGAKMEVDEANETAEGVWYKRGNLSIFIERSRIDHIERERIVEVAGAGEVAASKRRRRERGWTSGSARIDGLIRQNGARHDVDPYLVFCVMEQESHFNTRALSSMGARGLMQLMPGTAARFGVRNSHDPAQNISGGTRYLKTLLKRFNGRVDLVLAGYNAGEGAVMKYGHRVPPYRETRNYVRKISARYRQE
ncbi:MAG: lytic transglycosylase domain-containing protein [Acidobacteria bacterium]|nr:lytic transglycosylase domain-containing protein [Acidobacteriota bacterium]